MNRRKFILNSCTLCIGVAGLGMVLPSCSGTSRIYKPVVENGSVNVPLTEFLESNYVIVRTSNVDYDIFAYKNNENEFSALLMKCSHRDAPVQYSSGGLVCNEHGSRFGFDGSVKKAPATAPLSSLNVTKYDNYITIKLKSS